MKEGQSRADRDFYAAFVGGAPVTPPGVRVTEGPLADPVHDPVAFRDQQRSENKTASVTPATPSSPASARYFKQPPVAAVVSSAAAPEKTAASDIAPADHITTGPGGQPVRPEVVNRGTSAVTGMDVGKLPGPNLDPMRISKAPATGKKAPAPDAKSIASSIMSRLKGKSVPSSPVPKPASPMTQVDEEKKPSKKDDGVNRDRIEMTPAPQATKVASLLRAVGAPPSLVGDGSVLRAALEEKIAAVETAPALESAAYFERNDTHPMALWTMLGSRYGDDWIDWDLEVIQQTVAEDFGREPSTSTMNKIAALKVLTTKPADFYKDWHVFEKLAVALDGGAPRMALVEDLSPEQMAFAVGTVRMLAPNQITFSRDLQKYVAARLFEAGFVTAPPELGFSDDELKALVGSANDALRAKTMSLYAQALQGTEPHDIDQDAPPPEFVQASRLMRVHAYVLDKIDDLVRQAQ